MQGFFVYECTLNANNMKAPILIKYNISIERAEDIGMLIANMNDMPKTLPLETFKDNVRKELLLFRKNEIDFMNEICDVTYQMQYN